MRTRRRIKRRPINDEKKPIEKKKPLVKDEKEKVDKERIKRELEDQKYDVKLQQLLQEDVKFDAVEFKKKMFGQTDVKGNYSAADWYKRYKEGYDEKQYNIYHGFTKSEDADLSNITGFRSKNKNEALRSRLKIKENVPLDHNPKLVHQVFPVKKNKQYLLHLVYPEGTYFIDIMFSDKDMYLLMINFITRYVHITDLVNKSIPEVKRSFDELMENITDLKYLRGDAESAFVSAQFRDHLKQKYNADYIPIERKIEANGTTTICHDKLGVIDRMTRTLRDMAYVAGFTDPIPYRVMRKLVDNYNIAPHSFLSKYAHTSTSPEDVKYDNELKLRIWRNVERHNFLVKNKPGYQIDPNEKVIVYNDDKSHKRRTQSRPEIYTVVGEENGNYLLERNNGDRVKYSRFRIKPYLI